MKNIFITGAGAGIGRATAELFAERGWFVGLADRDTAAVQTLAEKLGAQRASAHPLDVSNYASVRTALDTFVATRNGELHVLHNNAGVLRVGAFEEITPQDHKLIVDINVTGVINVLHAAFPHLRQTPDALVINMSSGSALYGVPDFASYSATKHAVSALTEALDIEWATHGIRVTDIMPPFVKTAMVDDNRSATQLIRRMGVKAGPEHLAEAVWEQVHYPRLHRTVSAQLRAIAPLIRRVPSRVPREMLRILSGR
jgi:NAD(P)-dependent dehydrogenase (short-subunit alcohol dehydrogenase family)